MTFDKKVTDKLEFLYDNKTATEMLAGIKRKLDKYDFDHLDAPAQNGQWSENDVVLITYGDVILPPNEQANKLQALTSFMDRHLSDAVSAIHILPFFPYSSDQGFSVRDYKKVRDDLGDWQHIEALSDQYKVMADLVINHTSRFSEWFENFQINEVPGKDYFIEMDPSVDLSEVTRPRNTPLLSTVQTNRGLKYVWTTFSDDQIDLNFSNPDVLLEFIDIFLFYISKGIRLIRLDAIAYLWKKVGTSSIHLEETHQVIKLFRDIVDYIPEEVSLITETNVPFNENISYFGEGDEAHMIYQFSLPPLLLHAILTENGHYLTKWASELPEPRPGCTYFNFTASHDGIGVRPLEGLVPDEEFNILIKGTRKRGGFVSYKQNEDGSQSPYELNITYYDAFAEPGKKDTDLQVRRYLCSQAIMLSLQGVPGIYFHNLTATNNYLEGVAESGIKRDINRRQWKETELEDRLQDPSTNTKKVLDRYKEFLAIRKSHPAFSPSAGQQIYDLGDSYFAVKRQAREGTETILCISNLTSSPQEISVEELPDLLGSNSNEDEVKDLISDNQISIHPGLTLEPFQTVWLLV